MEHDRRALLNSWATAPVLWKPCLWLTLPLWIYSVKQHHFANLLAQRALELHGIDSATTATAVLDSLDFDSDDLVLDETDCLRDSLTSAVDTLYKHVRHDCPTIAIQQFEIRSCVCFRRFDVER